jgi:hypothetical protein
MKPAFRLVGDGRPGRVKELFDVRAWQPSVLQSLTGADDRQPMNRRKGSP